MNFLKKIKSFASLVRFEHTLFALPFGLSAAVVAARGVPALPVLGWILLAMVGARSAAMAFNRIVDRKIDAANPRTKNREIPRGVVSLFEAWAIVILGTAALLFSAWKLNPLAFALSPLALMIILGYSFTKRFTSFSHLVLGFSLGMAPIGAWIAVRGEISFSSVILCAAVMLWTAAFDILYALQDLEFDKKQKLFSLPRAVGAVRAIFYSRAMHAAMILLLISFGILTSLSWVYFLGVMVVAGCLFYEHTLVSPKDLSKINVAFFTLNGIVSVVFFGFTLLSVLLG